MNYYRKAKIDDLKEILKAVEDARAFLKEQGNGQWQDGYPNEDDFKQDIKNGRLFVVLDENNLTDIAGVCSLTYQEDDYQNLYEENYGLEINKFGKSFFK